MALESTYRIYVFSSMKSFQVKILGIITTFLILLSFPCASQTNSINDYDLLQLTYEEYYDILLNHVDLEFKNRAFWAYLNKAINDRDTLQLAQAYRIRSYDLDFLEGIKSVDSSIAIARGVQLIDERDFQEFMALAHYTKGALLYINDMNYSAAEQFIKCYDLAKKSNHNLLIALAMMAIADIKAVYGQEDEAILLQRRTLRFIKENKSNLKDFEKIHLDWTEQMSRCFLFSNELDSATIYIKPQPSETLPKKKCLRMR